MIPAATKSKINESYDGGSDSGLDFDYRSKNKNKIMVTGPIVDICGDQMAAIMWQNVKDQLILPFLDIKLIKFDLSI